MGLAGVELILAIENNFGIELSDAEAEGCQCPGQLINLALAKVGARKKRICPSQHAFYLLRRAVMKEAGAPRAAVGLDTDLRKFAPEKERNFWSALHTRTGVSLWLPLRRPAWLIALLWLVSMGSFFLLLGHLGWMAAGTFAGLLWLVGWITTSRFQSRIPGAYAKPRALAKFLIPVFGGPWSREVVAAVVRAETLARCSAKAARYHEKAEFYRDLWIGLNPLATPNKQGARHSRRNKPG
ncbi:MAG: acyl carrier protein [Verrucomicrobiales bacterium]